MHGSRLFWALVLGLLIAAAVVAHDAETETADLAELMQLVPGMIVADVGAGDGAFGERFAQLVGETGHVYLTEIGKSELRKIRRRVEDSDLTNMTVIEGESDETGLPEPCCDAMLLRYVVHHMDEREAMFASIRRALSPGGRLVVVEKVDPGDGIEEEDLVAGLREAGFEVLSRHPEWGDHDDHYAVVLGGGRFPTGGKGDGFH
jgi:ubiquinone/menaquinone biosynthesis C-methylase UbiE